MEVEMESQGKLGKLSYVVARVEGRDENGRPSLK
jgi:hypothetical protein